MTTSNEHNNAPAVLEQELSALLTTSLPYMTPVGRARLGQDIAQLYSSVSAPAVAQGEPVAWQARCVWPNGRKSTKWSLVTARNAELTPKMRAEYLARLTHPDGSPSYEVRALYAATPAPAPAQGEPFGYFRAEPFGWTDCAEDDEGAIALYERPQEVGLTDEALDNLIEDLSEWSRHVVEDTAHQTLEAHVREVLAKNPIIAALRAKGGKHV